MHCSNAVWLQCLKKQHYKPTNKNKIRILKLKQKANIKLPSLVSS